MGSNDVFTDPNDYVAAFTSIMEYYNVDNIIYAEHKGTTIKDSFLESYIIPSIHKGMPVTMYNAFGSVADVSNHYCNIFGYIIYEWYISI